MSEATSNEEGAMSLIFHCPFCGFREQAESFSPDPRCPRCGKQTTEKAGGSIVEPSQTELPSQRLPTASTRWLALLATMQRLLAGIVLLGIPLLWTWPAFWRSFGANSLEPKLFGSAYIAFLSVSLLASAEFIRLMIQIAADLRAIRVQQLNSSKAGASTKSGPCD